MTELSYRVSDEKFLVTTETGSRMIAAVWLMLYLVLVTIALSMPAHSGMLTPSPHFPHES